VREQYLKGVAFMAVEENASALSRDHVASMHEQRDSPSK